MELVRTEREAIGIAMKPHLVDIQGFFDGKPSENDVMEYMAWAYVEICNAIRNEYDRPLTGDDMPY